MLWSDEKINNIIWKIDNKHIEQLGLVSVIKPILENMRRDYEEEIKSLKETYLAELKDN